MQALRLNATRRQMLGGSLAAAVAAGLPLAEVRAAAPGRIKVITPQGLRLAFAELFVGVAGGHFKQAGVEVDIIGGASSPQAVQQVLSGQAIAGRTAGLTLLNAVAHGGAMRSIATIAHGSPFYMISDAKRPIEKPADFAGTTVGLISPNGPSENTLDAMLLDAGVPKSAVQRQYTGDNPGAFALLQAGRVSAFMGAIDTLLRAKALHADVVAFNTGKYMPLPGQVYVATQANIDGEGEALAAFLRGMRAAVEAMIADPAKTETLRLIKTFPIEGATDDALSLEILKANQDLWTSAGPDNVLRNVPENWTKGVDLALRAGFGAKVEPETLYTNALLPKA
jgi:NitT/TauT family transport system substrate-binding protein